MKKIATTLILAAMAVVVFAQSSTKRAVLNVNLEPLESEEYLSAVQTVPLKDVAPFLAYSAKWKGEEPVDLAIRFSEDGNSWTNWEPMHPDPHVDSRDGKMVSELMFAKDNQLTFQVKANRPVAELQYHFYSPGKSSEQMRESDDEEVASRACPCPIPGFFSREDWCPNGDCPVDPTPTYTAVDHLIVHHSAGPNTSSDWAAVVRSFWDFHVNTNGWDDIGYNWLIDPDGKVYLGRGNDVLGAHYCGMNTGTMGVCVIGDFTDIIPTTDAQSKLVDLLAWKCCTEGIDPLGISERANSGQVVVNIAGHRDGCSTACPGESFYPLLPNIRDMVSFKIIAGCSGLPGATNLTAVLDDVDAQLSWADNTEGESGYLLERSENDMENFTLLATIDADVTTYPDPGLTLGSDYYYRIRAYTDMDTSAYSNVVLVSLNVSSTSQLFNEQTVQLFPNPVASQLTVTINNPARGLMQASLLDVVGQQVLQQQTLDKNTDQAQFDFDLTDLPKGVYLLRMKMGEEQGLFRVVKQ